MIGQSQKETGLIADFHLRLKKLRKLSSDKNHNDFQALVLFNQKWQQWEFTFFIHILKD